MNKLSQMMRLYKAKLNLTNEDIASKTGLPANTIARICSGRTKAPKLETLKKIANLFEVSIEELSGSEDETVEPYYFDKKTAELAQKLKDDPQYRVLLDATRDLSPDDINAVLEIVKMIKRNNNG